MHQFRSSSHELGATKHCNDMKQFNPASEHPGNAPDLNLPLQLAVGLKLLHQGEHVQGHASHAHSRNPGVARARCATHTPVEGQGVVVSQLQRLQA